MVKDSLGNLIDKFPYFFNKSAESNFYKVQWVNNENFRDLYNSLYKCYESFHLTKRLLVWKEQSEDYNYSIKFVANFPNLKNVKIYKNDDLIYLKEYLEEDEADSFNFTYNCSYLKTLLYDVKPYYCEACGDITFSLFELQSCFECDSSNLTELNIYVCENCGEIYFSDSIPSKCTKCNSTNLKETHAYKCNDCEQIHFQDSLPETCAYCGSEGLGDIDSIIYYAEDDVILKDNRMIFEEDESEEIEDNLTSVVSSIEPEEENESFNNPADGVEKIIADGEALRIPVPIIPDDKFLIVVETYDEYILSKGFPENDKTYEEHKLNPTDYDDYDHDWSLDEFGALNNIPRKTYIDVTNPKLYSLTEPPYNKMGTEDDYHYMNRILEYNLRMWDTPAPVLEIWKLYGLEASLLNRERLLLKMFDETKHPFDEENGLVGCWYPQQWEHKDKFCDGSTSLGEYFFVEADTIRPTIYQNVNITFKLLNSLAEEITDNYLVDIYHYLEENTSSTKTLLKSNYDKSNVVISYDVFKENKDKTQVLQFVAHTEDNTIIGTEEIVINIRDCDDGDWYVSPNGNDETGDGSINNPFLTLDKAISVVNAALDLIVVTGDLILNDSESIPVVNTNCIILGCDDASISSNYNRQFFHIAGSKNINLSLVNLTLKNEEVSTDIKLANFTNANTNFYDFETVLIYGGEPILSTSFTQNSIYPYDYFHVVGDLIGAEGNGLTDKKINVLWDGDSLTTLTTDENGEFGEWILFNNEYDDKNHVLSLNFDTANYFETDIESKITYKQPITHRIKLSENVELISDGHSSGENVTYYSVDDNIVTTVKADNNGVAKFNLTPEWGNHIIYVYEDNVNELIKDEWVINTYKEINALDTKTFVSGIEFKDNGEFNLTTKTISKVSDINGLLLDIEFYDDLRYDVTYSTLPVDEYDEDILNGNELTFYEYNILKNAIVDITVDEEGNVILHRMED